MSVERTENAGGDFSRGEGQSSGWTFAGPQLGFALREAMKAGYGWSNFRADALAGVIVGIVALPLSMALAIACGVPPQHGLYTAIVAGGVTSLLGGSRTQISGPTAAFVVVLAPISAQFGLGGLMVASLMAGVLLVLFGLIRVGKFIEFVPYPVTTGFTAGIAVVIATLQFKDFLGLRIVKMPEEYIDRVHALATALPTTHPVDFAVGATALIVLLVWPKITTRIPSPLVALSIAAVAAFVIRKYAPDLEAATIGSRFSYLSDGVRQAGIPRIPPLPSLPWAFPGPDGQPLTVSFHLLHQLFPSACAIAVLGAVESLLSAVVADGMAGTRHDPDAELFAQGVGNIVSPFFGGFAATGALARTATNIRSGGRSPIAALVHCVFVLAAVLLLAPLVAYLPMASLAALLLLVAWNMSEAKHFVHLLKVAPRSDIFVMVTCFFLTVIFDMVVGVTAGVVMASFLFMHRMAALSNVKLIDERHPAARRPLPERTILYEIAGPLFFGATQKAMSVLGEIGDDTRIVILHMGAVPAMDATGLVSLESLLKRLQAERIYILLAEIQDQPERVLAKAGIQPVGRRLEICKKLETALELATVRAEEYRVAAEAAKSTSLLRSLSPERITKSLNPEWLRSSGGRSTGSLPPVSKQPEADDSKDRTKPLGSEPPPKG